jgi:hypothetical protein
VLTTEIVVKSPPYFVWAYFTQPKTWGAWAKVSLSSAHWRPGGRLFFEKGVTATVDAIDEGRSVTFGDSWSEETWAFEATPDGHTRITVTEVPRAVKYTDHGAAALARTRAKLERLKAAIEPTEEAPAAKPADSA